MNPSAKKNRTLSCLFNQVSNDKTNNGTNHQKNMSRELQSIHRILLTQTTIKEKKKIIAMFVNIQRVKSSY